MPNAVVITDAPKVNYMHNYTRLPYYYGTDRYYERPDVKGIRDTVWKNLNTLDEETGFKAKFRGRKVYIKPNNVLVYHDMGYESREVPESTDPRVLEAIVDYLTNELGCQVNMMEAPGKPAGQFAQWYDQRLNLVAKKFNTGLICLEEQPIDHYYLPKAQVMKDIYVPRCISEIVRGEALYVSVPKMKTNLYTGVTLGFKNAMGTLPPNMRARNHNYDIDKKLVDMLFLFQPDLTVIDGIIGGEGNTPAPVDPVKVGMIVSGTNSVEVDRIVTQIMGFDPNEIKLMQEADKMGFGDPDVRVIGDIRVVPFRPAEPSMMTPRFRKNWPNIHLYVGHTNSRAPKFDDPNKVTPDDVREMEKVCTGGCMATSVFALECSVKYKYHHDLSRYRIGVVMGNGVDINGTKYWFDETGKGYTVEDLKKEKKARKYQHMMGIGECTRPAYEACDITGGGCFNLVEEVTMWVRCVPNPALFAWHSEMVPWLGFGVMRAALANPLMKLKTFGKDRTDIPFDAHTDKIWEIPAEFRGSKEDWIFVPNQ